jgi:hypothetical protein
MVEVQCVEPEWQVKEILLYLYTPLYFTLDRSLDGSIDHSFDRSFDR